jgi:nitrite reductase/ring-hydroxylating ferredoxin subunit
MVRLCQFDDLLDGHARGFDPGRIGRDTIFVVRRGSALHAWVDECPHVVGSRLAWRKNAYLNASRTQIVCSGHGAEFDIDTGACTLGACEGQALQPVRVEIAPDGSVLAAETN